MATRQRRRQGKRLRKNTSSHVSARSTHKVSKRPTRALSRIVEVRRRLLTLPRRRATLANAGALAIGGAGAALASMVGVGELAVGAFAAYVAYRVIRYGVTPTEAIIEGVELEHGEIPGVATKVS